MAASWNPFRCGATALPVPLLLMAKLLILSALVTVRPEPILLVTAGAVLFNLAVPVSCLLCGVAMLASGSELLLGGLLLVLVLPFRAQKDSARTYPAVIWSILLVHAALLEFTTTAATPFYYAVDAAALLFVRWPGKLTVIYDGECGICNRIRVQWNRFDFDSAFAWESLQSGAGETWGLTMAALQEKLHLVADGKISSGFRACKQMMLYQPLTYFAIVLLVAAPPLAWARIVVPMILAFFFPPFEPIGEAAYNWVARNRYRLSKEGSCALESKQ